MKRPNLYKQGSIQDKRDSIQQQAVFSSEDFLMKKQCFRIAVVLGLLYAFPMTGPRAIAAENQVVIEPLIYADETDIANANLNVTAKATNRLEPTLSFAYRTDSNFYRVDDDFEKLRVDTYLVQPGLRFGYRTGKTQVDLGYTLNIYSYDDRDGRPMDHRNADDLDYTGHTLRLNADTRPTAKINLGLKEYFIRTRDQAEADHTTGLVGIQERYNYNQLEPWLAYRFSERFSSRLAYRHTAINYDKVNPEDATEHRGLFDLRYHLSPRNSIAVDYSIWNRDYNEGDADYTSNLIGLVYRRNAKFLYGELGAGYHHRSFDDGDRGSESTPAFRLAVTAQSSGLDESGRPKSYATLAFNKDFNSSGTSGNFLDTREVSLRAGHTFVDRILLDLEGFYRINTYEDAPGLTPDGTIEDRDDDRVGLVGSLGYRFGRWLVFSIRGGYENRDSNLIAYDYDNTYVMARLDSSYDFNLK